MIMPSFTTSFERLNPVEVAGPEPPNRQGVEPSTISASREQVSTREAALGESIEFALVKSGYPLQDVHCRCTESRLELTGTVWRYYYLQMTIEIARQLAGGREIINRVSVVAGPENAEFDDEA